MSRVRMRAAVRWASLLSGLAATLAGLIAFIYVLWGPFSVESGVLTSGERLPAHSHGLIEGGIEGLVLLQLIGLAMAIAGVAVGSYVGFQGSRVGALLLRACTLLLFAQASVSFFGLGWLFMPAALLAIIDSVSVPDGADLSSTN
jgi:hypothetical protein